MSDDTNTTRLRTLLSDTDIGSRPHLDPQAIMRAGLRRRYRRHAAASAAAVSVCVLAIGGTVLHQTSLRQVAPSAASKSSSPVGSASPPTPSGLATPESTGEPAKGCSPDPDPVVTFTINPDTPVPSDGCAIVSKNQRLRVVNATNAFNQPGAAITLTFAGLPPRTLQRGQATTYDMPFGTYLAPGQHWLHVSYYHGSLIVIWLQ